VPGDDQAGVGSVSPIEYSWAELLTRHRKDWALAAVGDRKVVDVDNEPDPAASIARVSADGAIVWIESFSERGMADLRQQLGSAVGRGVPVVVGLPGGESEWQEAQLLRDQLGEAVVVVQQLAAGSLIGSKAPSDAAHVLVCANLESLPADRNAAELEAKAVPLLSGYVAYLERSNRALSDANVRLARERLGVHDAAAAAVEARRTELERRIQELERRILELGDELAAEKRHTQATYDLWVGAKQALQAPRYRAVDTVRDVAFSLPGVAYLLRRRSERLQARY
jgi:hypothetical protein